MKVCVVGAGWAGVAAAVNVVLAGHSVTLHEASPQAGGRARALPLQMPDGSTYNADNGQHILIGAYTECLRLMRSIGIAPEQALLRLPLAMPFPDGRGLRLPNWPSPLDAAAGILGARGWSLADKLALVARTARWQKMGFVCAPEISVADLCRGLPSRVMQLLIEPLCVSALNTPVERSSGQVFLRVLQDSLLGGKGSSNLLIPRVDLGQLFPQRALSWLGSRGARVHLGSRVTELTEWTHLNHMTQVKQVTDQVTPGQRASAPAQWAVQGQVFDAVLWATSSSVAVQAMHKAAAHCAPATAEALQQWADVADGLQFEAICTVYAHAPGVRLPHPMMALHSQDDAPAQFVFDRSHFGGPAGLLALVVSASGRARDWLTQHVLQQARTQLAPWVGEAPLTALQTVVEKRATFACTPNLQRPWAAIAPGLWACGDYVQGPYPATLEGAVRSAQEAVAQLGLQPGAEPGV